jgi:hypothetical protein
VSAERLDPSDQLAKARVDASSVMQSKRGTSVPPREARLPLFAESLTSEWRNADNVVDNLVFGLASRVYIERSQWNPVCEFNEVLREAAIRLGRQMEMPLCSDGIAEVLRNFPSAKRQLYEDALHKSCEPWRNLCTAFVKDEWTKVKTGKLWKPRVIQFRKPEYLAHMLSVYKPIEHAFYHGRWLFNRAQKYTCAKGANPHQRVNYLRKLVSELRDPVVVDLDGSAFDAHVSVGALNAEWRFYLLAAETAGWPKEALDRLRLYAASQQRNKCQARCRDGFVKYKVVGNRMSGDLNTGNGNSVLQSCFIASAMRHLNIPDQAYRMYVDGDDAVLLCEREYKDRLVALPKIFEGFSQELKVGAVLDISVDGMENLEFCQARPVCVNGQWRMVRNPDKVINCYMRSFRWSKTDDLFKRYFAGIAAPEMIINADVPILDRYFSVLHELSGDARPLTSVGFNYWRRTVSESQLSDYVRSGISWGTRESFAKAFGIDPAAQILAELLIDVKRDGERYL